MKRDRAESSEVNKHHDRAERCLAASLLLSWAADTKNTRVGFSNPPTLLVNEKFSQNNKDDKLQIHFKTFRHEYTVA